MNPLRRAGRLRLLLALAPIPLAACAWGQTTEGAEDSSSAGTNVLLLVLDDVGRDKLGCYGVSSDAGPTPNLDAIANKGLVFRTAWATPYCSPTRATILTGRYPTRTGIGAIVDFYRHTPGLSLDEWTLPEAAKQLVGPDLRAGMVGKWHLAGARDGMDHPRTSGFDCFFGTMRNLGPRTAPAAYFSSAWVEDGAPIPGKGYATTRTVDSALRFIGNFEEGRTEETPPWFVMVSFHAAHFPLHAPPEELHTFELDGTPTKTPLLHHRAMVQAMDTEIGRLLAGLDNEVSRRTTLIIVGDNGTQNSALGEPLRKGTGKGTLHEGGVGVPLIFAGAGVTAPGRETDAFAHTVDLFPTIVDLLAGSPQTLAHPAEAALDGVSLVPVLRSADAPAPRTTLYSEFFDSNHVAPDERKKWNRAVRVGNGKLIVPSGDVPPRLYRLDRDPHEATNLLASDTVSEEDAALRLTLENALNDAVPIH